MIINSSVVWPTPMHPLPDEAVSGHASMVGVLENVTNRSEQVAFGILRGGLITPEQMNPSCVPVPFWLGVPLIKNLKEARPYLPGDANIDRGAIFPNMGGQKNLYHVLQKSKRR